MSHHATRIKQRKEHIKRKGYQPTEYVKIAYQLGRKDYVDALNSVRKLNKKTRDPVAAVMKAKARRQRSRPRKGGRKRGTPAALRPMRITVKRVVMYEKTSGSEHRWYYHIPVSLFAASFTASFQEFKVTSFSVRYIPNNSLSETGLYCSILLDRDGFGSYGAATATSWFTYLGNMPGSIIKPRHASSQHRWRPTEPSARDWLNKDQLKTNLATIYVCNNGKETEELGGLLEIRGVMLVRGRFWDAAISSVPTIQQQEPSSGVSACPTCTCERRPLSRTSSQASLVGGFVALSS